MGTAGFRPEGPILFATYASLGLVVVWAARSRRIWVLLTVMVLAATSLLSGLREIQLHSGSPAALAAQHAAGVARVRLVGDPRLVDQGPRPQLVVATAELLRLQTRGVVVETAQPVVVFASAEAGEQLVRSAPGSVVELRGSLAPAEPTAPEALVIRARRVSGGLEEPGALDSLVNSLRAGLRDATANSPPTQAALVPSLVVGDTAGITKELSEQFKATSLSHLLAVSGANLTLMLSVVLGLARTVGVRGWAVRLLAVVCVALFVAVCRSEPSVVRAAAMGLVTLSAMGVGRGRRSVRHLCLAVLCLMLVDPWLSRSWGFALSVAACSGIALLSQGWTRAMTWVPRPLAEALTIPLAAQLATQPIITALSGQVSVVGVLANMLAGPFVGPATVLGLAATCLVWFPPAAMVFAWLAGWCVQPILWIAEFGSGLPSASWSWPADALGVALCAAGCLLVAHLAGHALRSPSAVLALLTTVLLAATVRPVPLGWPGDWQAVFCDVGQGDATLLRAAEGVAVLVDAGGDPAPVESCLASVGVTSVPILVLTHYHADHVGGAVAVLARYRPQIVVVSPLASPPHAAASVRSAADAVGARVLTAVPGQVLSLGQVHWTTVAGHQPRIIESSDGEESSGENDSSVVGVADVGGLRVLLPGDAEPAGQRRALAAAADHGLDLSAHVLKFPHHGSSRQEEEFFAASEAALAVVSAGRNNDYGHPADAALKLASRHGMAVARTDLDGSVAVSVTEGALEVRRAGAPSG